MRILQINTVYGEGSTGKIAEAIHDVCLAQGMMCRTAHRFVPRGETPRPDSFTISSKWNSRLHGWLSRFTMFKGAGSFFRTLHFLHKVKRYAPDLIHLHNLHGSYIHLPLLFRYIRRHRIPVVWTLHDCWPFTAICSHFVLAGCDKWKHGCHHCPQRKRFSAAPADLTPWVWRAKKQWFGGVESLTVVTPSRWLAGLVQESFLKEYPVRTLYNGIDTTVFRPTPSDVRARYGISGKKLVLGVAFDWGYGKGLDVFIELAKRLEPDIQVVLVGTNATVDRTLPDNIVSVHRTQNPQELAELYTAADVFVNPTREEVLGLVNLEALACGTPVVTFRTGGSPECVDDTCGVVVEVNDVDAMEREVCRICATHPFDAADCRRRAEAFDKTVRIGAYTGLYREVLGK
ncbi:MAG: glycosyltransferase [Clostridia bacterium]|nr:glycosyltransferase [Clostridia bacterium]